jgi:repressor LexA
MREEITIKQRKVLDKIKKYQQANGFPPTVRELAEMFGHSSTAGIYKILKALQKKGYLNQSGRGKSRGFGVSDAEEQEQERVASLPIVGQVTAGQPQLALELRDGEFFIDSTWIRDRDTFLLRVNGYSMIDADIRPGDLLMVEPNKTFRNGDIIIAMLEDEATVKRFFNEKDRIRLQPENNNMQPIYIKKNDPSLRIVGKVRGLLRKY